MNICITKEESKSFNVAQFIELVNIAKQLVPGTNRLCVSMPRYVFTRLKPQLTKSIPIGDFLKHIDDGYALLQLHELAGATMEVKLYGTHIKFRRYQDNVK